MGAKDVFTNPQFLSSMAGSGAGPGGGGGGDGGGGGGGHYGGGKSLCSEHKNCGRRREVDEDEESIEQEWHQKYAFIIGLLRKPHAVLIKESLARERNKISQKLHAYTRERDYVQDLWSKAKLRSNNNILFNNNSNRDNSNSSGTGSIEIRSDDDTEQSLGAQMKHLDMMCVTLQRQMDVLSNVDQALPTTENIYSGEPDSLDGTSSEIMMTDDLETSRAHFNNNNNNNNRTNQHSNFQLIVNGRSPLDAYAMLHLERCAHRETRNELILLRKKYEVLRDEFDSGEGLSQSTSLLFSRLTGELLEDEELEEAEEGVFSNNLTNDRTGNDMSVETNGRTSGGGGRLLTAAEVRLKEMTISQLRSTLEHLEKTGMTDKVPVDSAREIARLHSTLVQLERVRDELTLQNLTLKSKLAELSARITDSTTFRLEKHNNNNNSNQNPLHSSQLIESGESARNSTRANKKDEQEQQEEEEKEEKKKKKKMELESGNPLDSSSSSEQVSETSSTRTTVGPKSSVIMTDEMKLKRKSTYKVAHHNNTEANAEIKQLRAFINDLHAKEIEYQKRIADLETQLRNARNHSQSQPPIQSIPDHNRHHQISPQQQQQQHVVVAAFKREPSAFVQRSLINSGTTTTTTNNICSQREEEGQALKLDLEKLSSENKRLKDDLNLLHTKIEKEQTESLEKLTRYEKEMGVILEQNKLLQEDFAHERCLRKKYFNMVEELKGKIRVFCRIRPPSKTEKAADILVRRSDPYTVTVDTPAKGLKEFHFDRVFVEHDSQDQIFEDTKNLIKSAFDGYNVCICAYGQTGSGKTYTILGDELNPGIAPRTFQQIFSHANSMSQSYETQVSIYCLELYNDKLIDLLNPPPSSSSSASSTSSFSSSSNNNNNNNNDHGENKLEIRRDRKGIVWVSGARVLSAGDSSSLELHFRQALQSRHTASTKMNDRSSRSHLVVGLIIETTSKVNGTILRGKISLVDLAGSERTGKSGVSANTLREANAINKSLSAFGDVINALTTDQSFVPYRNNKLTLLMQDSIGGNAKTLMFVNISPSSFNMEETIISLSYASRVKQVTNSVTRNSESKEIARLKNIISRLKRGESSAATTAEDDI